MTTKQEEGEERRIIMVDPTSDKVTAKDRTGQLGREIDPDFTAIVEALQGTKEYAWCKPPKAAKTDADEPKEDEATDAPAEGENTADEPTQQELADAEPATEAEDAVADKTATASDKLSKAKAKKDETENKE